MYDNPTHLIKAQKPYSVIIEFVWGDSHTISFDKDYEGPHHGLRIVGDGITKVPARWRAKLYADECRKNGATIEEDSIEYHVPVTSIKWISVGPT